MKFSVNDFQQNLNGIVMEKLLIESFLCSVSLTEIKSVQINIDLFGEKFENLNILKNYMMYSQ